MIIDKSIFLKMGKMRKSVLCLVPVAVKVFRQHRRVNGTLLHFINREVKKVRKATWKEEGKGKEEEEEVVGGEGQRTETCLT